MLMTSVGARETLRAGPGKEDPKWRARSDFPPLRCCEVKPHDYAMHALVWAIPLLLLCLAYLRQKHMRRDLGIATSWADVSPFALARSAAAPLDAAPVVVKVLCMNVWGHYFAGGWGISKRLAALACEVAASGADVVALQELFLLRAGPLLEAGHFLEVAEALRSFGLEYAADPREVKPPGASPTAGVQSCGLALFSRHPILQATTLQFPASQERLNCKGVMVATLYIPAKRALVHVVNTHFDSRGPAIRAQQAAFLETAAVLHATRLAGSSLYQSLVKRGLLPLASEQRLPPGAIVVCGDFNTCPASGRVPGDEGVYAAIQEVVERVMGEPAVDLFPGPPTSPPTSFKTKLGAPVRPVWIDHAFVAASAVGKGPASHGRWEAATVLDLWVPTSAEQAGSATAAARAAARGAGAAAAAPALPWGATACAAAVPPGDAGLVIGRPGTQAVSDHRALAFTLRLQ